MSFRNKRGSISVFAFMVVSMIALGIGALMISNFSVYQLSKSYHILRERLLIKKMLFQVTEEVVLSRYELSNSEAEPDLLASLTKEVESIAGKTGLVIDGFELLESGLKESIRTPLGSNSIFEGGYTSLNPRIASYLNQGPYTDCGQATFLYDIHGRSYSIKASGYGVPLSNFDLTLYDLPSSLGSGVGLKRRTFYTLAPDGNKVNLTSEKNDINYKNRKDVSFFCNAYEWLWRNDYLEKLSKESENSFVLELPFSGELEENGVALINHNEVTLNLEKIEFDVFTVSDPLGEATIKFIPSVANSKPLVIVVHNNLKSNKSTVLEIDQSVKRPVVFFVLNTEVVFQNNPEIGGSFFLDPNSKARGGLFLDGHFSCYSGADFMDMLNLRFDRTVAMKIKLASMVPHVFLTDIALVEDQ